jgi:hypothetical protein
MRPITAAVRTYVPGLDRLDGAALSDLVRELLQNFDDLGAEGLDRVIAANDHLDPDDVDRLFHLAMVAKHGADADAVTVEALAFAAFRETASPSPSGSDVDDAAPQARHRTICGRHL